MKKIYLKLLLFLGIVSSTLGANATTIESTILESVEEGANNADASVVVGDVEVPVYEVVVIWNDLTFDWVYDEDDKEFSWKPTPICYGTTSEQENIESLLESGANVYSDSSCSESINSYSDSITQYYVSERLDYVSIGIEDMSVHGQIVPSIKWTVDDKYSDVVANFKYSDESCTSIDNEEVFNVAKEFTVFSDSACTNIVEPTTFEEGKYYVFAVTEKELKTEEIPNSGRVSGGGGQMVPGMAISPLYFPRNIYRVMLYLDGGTQSPKSGDTIGTITITIRAAE